MVNENKNKIPLNVDEWVAQYKNSNTSVGIKPFKIAIGLPMLFPYVHYKFVDSFMMLKKPDNYLTLSVPGSLTSLARNTIVDIALSNECSHIMFLDTDMTFPKDTILKLLNHDKDIVGGLYFERYHPYRPAVFWKDMDNEYVLPDNIPENKLIECDAIGTGCLLIKTTVFSRLKKPYFEYRLGPYGISQKEKFFSEDIVFSELCKKEGFNIYCDTSIECGHLITDVEVNKNFWIKDEMR